MYREVFGFDPENGNRTGERDFLALFEGMDTDCTVLAGDATFSTELFLAGRPPSQVTDDDLAALSAFPRTTVLPRIRQAGHCLLLDNPWACVAALRSHGGG